MKIFPKNELRAADAKEMSHQGERAFTMVEIAIAIGVIGFALVAIIGVLPTGMNSQKDNREDTVISQDAPFFLDAIRNGAPVTNGTLAYSAGGLDFLTNYVQLIQSNYYSNGVITAVSNYPLVVGAVPGNSNYPSGAEIIGLLSTPQNNYNSPFFASNNFEMVAYVRALSGPASAQQFGANSGPSAFMAFTYKMEVFVTPFNSFAPSTTNWNSYTGVANADTNQSNICYNRWLAAAPQSVTGIPGSGALGYNLFDVRLRFSWPVNINGTNISVGKGRQTYRTLVSSTLSESSANGVTGWFFQPQYFTNVIPNNL